MIKCVSETSAMSILLFWSMAKISFFWFTWSFEFKVRMRRDFELSLLVSIVNFCEIWETSGQKGYKRIYDRFKFVEKFKKSAFVVIDWCRIWIGWMVTLSYICIWTWFGGVFSGWLLMEIFDIGAINWLAVVVEVFG